MHPRLAGLWLALALGAAFPVRAATLSPAAEHRGGEVALRGAPVRLASAPRQSARERGPGWRSFEARHGRWAAVWNEVTSSPHRAIGRPIALPPHAEDAAGVDAAVRAFVAEAPEAFGPAPELETASVQRVEDRWYVRYRQTFHGVPLAFADWEFRVRDGRLIAFGADAHRVPEGTPTRPRLVAAAAREAARAGLEFDPASDRLEGGDRLWLVPIAEPSGVRYRLAYEVEVRIADPPASWATLVDAENGTVLWRHDRVRAVVSGTVTGDVHLVLPTDPPTTRPMAHETVSVDNGDVTTDAAGFYSGAASGSAKVISKLSGPYCVADRPGPDASFTVTVTDPASVNIAWTTANSLDAERDGFYHVNLVHDYLKGIDPGFTGNDYPMACRVEITSDVCNAYWDGSGLNFYAAGGGCPSMATLPDVVYHEYGHGVNDNLYRQAGISYGMINGALHEGLADALAALLQDDSDVGQGFFGPGTVLRSVDNTLRWPEDRSGDPHATGLIVAGAVWDMREALGLALATHLSHFAKYGVPDDLDDGIAMNEYFLETLVADDDDGDLSNGTPHFAQINAAFNAHGIGTSYYLGIGHAPLADQPSPGPYPITATVTYAGPIGALDASSPTLHVSLNGGAYFPIAMTPGGGPGQYAATLPAVAGAIVRYWVSAADVSGGETTSPLGAPAEHSHVFLAGATTVQVARDLETDPGWTVGDAGDAATTGVWIRAEPVGTAVSGVQVQPELDHTPDPGALCFVTGNAAVNDPIGANDVDGGKTTLLTQVFSASGLTNPVVEYYRWYTNNSGADPGNDFWRVDLSNDGGATWAPIENTKVTDNSWRRVVFFIADVLPPTATMRLRFVAEDAGPASLVEAAVDDFRLLSLPPTTGVGDVARPALELRAPWPNPFTDATTFRYALPSRARVSLSVLDVSGRLVRQLDEGEREPGEHQVSWDGRDRAGHPAPSGAYFARLVVEGRETVRTLVRVR